jgi:hypothetical protein
MWLRIRDVDTGRALTECVAIEKQAGSGHDLALFWKNERADLSTDMEYLDRLRDRADPPATEMPKALVERWFSIGHHYGWRDGLRFAKSTVVAPAEAAQTLHSATAWREENS